MRSVLVDVFGEDWLDEFWPFVSYLVGEVKRAWSDGFVDWSLNFWVDGCSFSGEVFGGAVGQVLIVCNGRFVLFDVFDDVVFWGVVVDGVFKINGRRKVYKG